MYVYMDGWMYRYKRYTYRQTKMNMNKNIHKNRYLRVTLASRVFIGGRGLFWVEGESDTGSIYMYHDDDVY
jgi:hypothetical protein